MSRSLYFRFFKQCLGFWKLHIPRLCYANSTISQFSALGVWTVSIQLIGDSLLLRHRPILTLFFAGVSGCVTLCSILIIRWAYPKPTHRPIWLQRSVPIALAHGYNWPTQPRKQDMIILIVQRFVIAALFLLGSFIVTLVSAFTFGVFGFVSDFLDPG